MILLSLYLDDGIIIRKHRKLRQVLEFFESQEATKHGLHLRLDKCSIWWPAAPDEDTRAAYPSQVKQEYGDGTWILGAPVESDSFVRHAALNYVRTLVPLTNAIRDLEDMQVALTLFRNCAGACRMVYLLRTVPTSLASEEASLFDDLLLDCVREMVGGSLGTEVFCELQLPLSTTNPCFGVGLTSAEDTASSAFLSSMGLVRSLHCFMLQRAIPTEPNAKQDCINAYHDWRSRVHHDAILPWEAVSSSHCPSKRKLSRRVHDTTQRQLPAGNERKKVLRAFLGVLGAKDWLKAQPSPGLGTHIQDRDFRLWFKVFCRIPLFNGTEKCPQNGCNSELDKYGDHLLHCPNGMQLSASPRIWTHNSQARLLWSDLRKTARQPLLEPREGGQHPSRPDIRTLGANGGSDYLDVTIVQPLSSQRRIVSCMTNPHGTLINAHREKERKNQTFIERMGPNPRIVPIPIP